MDPQNDEPRNDDQTQRDAAEKVVRDQLDAIYHNQPHVNMPARSNEHHHHKHHKQHPQQPQNQTQQSSQFVADPEVNPWQKYHQQWQEYYQRYYENYYVGHMHQVIQEKDKEKEEAVEAAKSPDQKKAEEIEGLRAKIVDNAKEKAQKARKSRHFIPLMSAIVVVLVVAFLQYNQIIIGNVQAYVSPGAIDPQNIVVDPNSDTHVTADPRLIIPKINVDVPVIYNVALDYNAQMAAMQKGVAHFAIPGADSVPGQLGNTVFSGHSSNDLFDPGDYKFIFAQLDKLQQGDTIYVNYNSVRYTYTVTKTAIVKPSDVNALEGYTDKPYLTLITCTPLGTSLNRLLVYAEQVAPDPSKASAANSSAGGGQATIPGNAPTVLERLFGAH